jgi:FMN phosphatase YigB (HAD superfamily)
MKPQIVGPTTPVVAIDIDGTLAQYHAWFLQFAELYLGRPMPMYEGMAGAGETSLWRWMRVSKSTYREVKLAYRQGGMKRSMPPFEGAKELVQLVRRTGAEVWICTTRPYLRLDNIDPDTRHWLRRNGIRADGVIYGANKYRQLVRIVGHERVVTVLDDLPELCAQAKQVGIDPVIIHRPHNEVNGSLQYQGVYHLNGAAHLISRMVKDWKEARRGQ